MGEAPEERMAETGPCPAVGPGRDRSTEAADGPVGSKKQKSPKRLLRGDPGYLARAGGQHCQTRYADKIGKFKTEHEMS